MTKNLDLGRASRELGSPAVKEIWERCDQMNEGRDARLGVFVPSRSVDVRREILPRKTDEETVRRYRELRAILPPVTVQRDSLTLIGGLHRWEATVTEQDYIAVVEVDIPDDELADFAIRDNIGHGKPYTLAERQENARAITKRHSDWSLARVAEWSGVSPRWLNEQSQRTAQRDREAEEGGQFMQNARTDPGEPRKVLGRDGKLYPARPGQAPPRVQRGSSWQQSPPPDVMDQNVENAHTQTHGSMSTRASGRTERETRSTTERRTVYSQAPDIEPDPDDLPRARPAADAAPPPAQIPSVWVQDPNAEIAHLDSVLFARLTDFAVLVQAQPLLKPAAFMARRTLSERREIEGWIWAANTWLEGVARQCVLVPPGHALDERDHTDRWPELAEEVRAR